MNQIKGTPKTLDEAILNAICIGPANEVQERLYQHTKDFMAQKFAVAYLNAGNDEKALAVLETLFVGLTRREK